MRTPARGRRPAPRASGFSTTGAAPARSRSRTSSSRVGWLTRSSPSLRLGSRRAGRGCGARARRAPACATACRRQAVQLGLDLARVRREQQDPTADRDRLLDRVGDEEHGEAGVVPEPQQLVLHLAAGERVERGEGLVHQQDVRLHGHAAGDGDALLHAARKRVGIGCRRTWSGRPCRCSGRPARRPARWTRRCSARAKRTFCSHRLPGEELVELLEDHHPVRAGLGDRVPSQADAPLDRSQIAAHRLEQGGFPAARGAEQDETVRRETLKSTR